jgi:hypothetical protein
MEKKMKRKTGPGKRMHNKPEQILAKLPGLKKKRWSKSGIFRFFKSMPGIITGFPISGREIFHPRNAQTGEKIITAILLFRYPELLNRLSFLPDAEYILTAYYTRQQQ